jgi:hypothetical protein
VKRNGSEKMEKNKSVSQFSYITKFKSSAGAGCLELNNKVVLIIVGLLCFVFSRSSFSFSTISPYNCPIRDYYEDEEMYRAHRFQTRSANHEIDVSFHFGSTPH